MEDRSSPLYGKYIICSDILGNYAHIHQEWAGTRSSGWSPAYTASSLLINMQSILYDISQNNKNNISNQKSLYNKCMEFFKPFDSSDMHPPYGGQKKNDAVIVPATLEISISDNELISMLKQHVPNQHHIYIDAIMKRLSSVTSSPSCSDSSSSSSSLFLSPSPSSPSSHDDAPDEHFLKCIEHLESLLNSTLQNIDKNLKKFGNPSDPQVVSIYSSFAEKLGSCLCWHTAPSSLHLLCVNMFQSIGWNPQRCQVESESAVLSLPALVSAVQGLVKTIKSMQMQEELKGTKEIVDDVTTPKCDPDIVCWFSLSHYTEAILGIGIEVVANGSNFNLSTDGSFLSLDAFQEGLRQTPMKDPFSYILPVWISPLHSVNNPTLDWNGALVSSIHTLGVALGVVKTNELTNDALFATQVLRIYPDLINIITVRMMQPSSDIRVSERTFGLLIDLWRTFMYLTERYPLVKTMINQKVLSFATDAKKRDKKAVPNIGWLLAMRCVTPDEIVPFSLFFKHYIEESFLRSVMRWKKKQVKAESEDVYNATEVSRHLFLFQCLFIRHVIGRSEQDMQKIVNLADNTECKLTDHCSNMFASWKAELRIEDENAKRRASAGAKWGDHFRGCDCEPPCGLEDMGNWIRDQANTAQTKEGYFFSSGGRGSSGGRYPGRGGGHHDGRGAGHYDGRGGGRAYVRR